jgi:hypothetical protein
MRETHAIARRIFNSSPNKENEKFLDINLNIPVLSCGLFNFNWDVLKMVNLFLVIKIFLNYLNFFTGHNC